MAAYMTSNEIDGTQSGVSNNLTYDSLLGTVKKALGVKKEKVKIHSDEAVVADTMVGFLKNKETDLKSKLDTKSKEKAEVEAKIKELIRKARTLQSTTGTLAKKYAETVNKNRSEVVDDYRKVITKIKLLDFIEKFEVDSKKRILFTTTPVSIQKPDWSEAKVAGRYQVRIDFKKGNIGEGIQGINIDQHYNEYDHPNLKSGKFCYGSKLAVDVEQDYREQDLYELVIDLVDLLRSPNDKDGWTRWGYFFQGAKKRVKGYSFQKWDNEDIETGLGAMLNDTISTFSTQYTSLASVTSGTTGRNYYPMPQMMDPLQNNSQRMGHFSEDGLETVAVQLLRLGFIDHHTAQYFADRILHRTHGSVPDSIELRRIETAPQSDYELFYRYGYDEPMMAAPTEVTAMEYRAHRREMVDKILVPSHLLRPEGSPQTLTRSQLIRAHDEMRMERYRMENQIGAQAQRYQNASEEMARKMADLANSQARALGVPQGMAHEHNGETTRESLLNAIRGNSPEEKIEP